MLLAMANTAPVQQTKDTTFTKIFVGGLPYHTTNETLEEFFKQFGDIEEAVVINDRQTGKSKGYGFVTMADRQAAERACEEPNPVIDGRKANVNLAYLGAKPRVPQTGIPTPMAAYPGFIQGQFGLPMAAYPSAYMTAAGTAGMAVPSAASSQHSPSSPTAALQLALDYPFGYPAVTSASTNGAQAHSQYLPGFEAAAAAYPYGLAANYFTGAAYSYAHLPPHLAGHLTTQLQPQNMSERTQLS